MQRCGKIIVVLAVDAGSFRHFRNCRSFGPSFLLQFSSDRFCCSRFFEKKFLGPYYLIKQKDCDYVDGMVGALYACCAFWLTDAFLFLFWSFTAFNMDSYKVSKKKINYQIVDTFGHLQYDMNDWRSDFTIEKVFVVLNGIGVFVNIGIWTSAAATVTDICENDF